MQWKLTIFGIAVITALVCAQDFSDTLIITKLRLTTKTGVTNPLQVCYTGVGTYTAPAKLVAEDQTANKVLEVPSVGEKDGCFIFDVDTKDLIKTPLKLILTTTKSATIDAKDGLGQADITLPADDNYPDATQVEVIGKGSMQPRSIRLKDILPGNVQLKIDNVVKNCPIAGENSETFGPPCYFMDVSQSAKFDACDPSIGANADTNEPVEFCADVAENSVDTKETGSITTITIDHKGTQISLVAQPSTTDAAKAEMVVQKPDGTLLKICQMTSLTGNCGLLDTNEEAYSIFIAYTVTDGSNAVSFEPTTLTNRFLVGKALAKDVIEGSWSFESSKQYFEIERTPNTPEHSFSKGDVDCSHMATTCYVYFTGLEENEYDLSLKVIKSTWPDATEFEPEEEKSDEITGLNPGGLSTYYGEDFQGIHVEPIITTVADKNIELDVCFKYNTNSSSKNTAYEFLAVNSKGQWKKITGENKKSNSHACFNAIELPLANFSEQSKFFVLLRDTNNGKPLASGEVKLNLPDVKAIKPDEDKSSDGSTSTLAIVGAAIGGVACLMALVAAAILFVMKRKSNNDGLQYPLHHTNVEDVNAIHGLDNPNST